MTQEPLCLESTSRDGLRCRHLPSVSLEIKCMHCLDNGPSQARRGLEVYFQDKPVTGVSREETRLIVKTPNTCPER